MKAHAALPDRKDLQRVGQVVRRLVEQAVADAPAGHHTEHAEEQDVLHIAPRPRRVGDAGKGLVAQAQVGQPHEEAKRREVGEAVPVDGQRTDLQGNGVDLGVLEHRAIVPLACFAPRSQDLHPDLGQTG
ncbi:hypothetical protein FQZ97_930260 [compost metagenome]